MPDDAPTPAGSSAEPPAPRRPRAGWAVLAFALAALGSSWNPVAAPLGLVVGLVAAALAIRALRRERPRRTRDVVALALSTLAVLASAVILALTAGAVGVDLPGEPVVLGRTVSELDQVLSDAGERTRARRERATQELEATGEGARGAAPAQRPGGGPAATRDRR